MPVRLTACLLGIALLGAGTLLADPAQDADQREQSKEALGKFNSLIGGWRGTGQPKRGSSKDAWIESAEWVWDLKKTETAITYSVKSGKQLDSARLTYDPKSRQYTLAATLPDKSTRTYVGTLEENKLTLTTEPDKAGMVHQMVVTLLNDKRTLVLYQNRRAEQEQFQRVAEVGYTREGTKLAVEGAGEPECVVTGGKGTSSIVYKGKTYYFCCSGCREAFNDDPEGVIADYEKTLAKRKAEMK
jgi:YHS domain-containing protein